jgi:hypothetical protein
MFQVPSRSLISSLTQIKILNAISEPTGQNPEVILKF